MRAIQAMRPGAPGVLAVVNLPDPEPGPGQVLVRTAAIGVNFIDTYRRSGVYKVPFPHIPGSEGAGRIVALGEGAEQIGLAVDQPVAWAQSVTGSYADLVVVEADRAIPLPDDMDCQIAAALALQGLTADYLVHGAFEVAAGQTVVLYAAAGGVGGLATQMIRASGARLIATVGKADKVALVTEYGVAADDVLNLGAMRDLTQSIPDAVRERTGGVGADCVFDSVGRDTFAASMASLRRRGTLVLFGGSSGQVAPFDPQELNAHGSIFLTRPTLADYIATREEFRERANRVYGAAMTGGLRPRIGGVLRLDQAIEAHTAIESGNTVGKIILVP